MSLQEELKIFFKQALLSLLCGLGAGFCFGVELKAQDVEVEEMICRDLGDVICLLEEYSKTVGPKGESLAAKVPPKNGGNPFERTVIDIQTSRIETKLQFPDGSELLEATLINLNPNINAWYLLKLVAATRTEWFHLENPDPSSQWLELRESYPQGLWLRGAAGAGEGCELWGKAASQGLRAARQANAPYVALCGHKLFLRNRIEGYRTTKEWVVEFLRAKVWGGEAITNLVKETVFKDSFLIQSEPASKARDKSAEEARGTPAPAQLGPEYKGTLVPSHEMGLSLAHKKDETMELGAWYRTERQPGTYVSVLEARAIDPSILRSYRNYVRDLDDVELKSVSFLVAFDLSQYDLSFAVGTDHPAVGWSERVLPDVRDPRMKGPDGFDTIEPLTGTGLIPPYLVEKVAGIFTGGFKRDHGAFRWGDLARKNFGSHYGVVEQGVVLSTPQPGLASLIVYRTGQVEMKTWDDEDLAKLASMRFVRQNGMPIIENLGGRRPPAPGEFVSNWTLGNWSGSQDKKFRSLRAGVCLSNQEGRSFLIYAYFSSITPSGMARIFQAYGCDYAMHLDMNALEHTYMSLYAQQKNVDLSPQHLVRGMKVLDERFKGNVPRYIGYPDNRDFFFLTQKKGAD